MAAVEIDVKYVAHLARLGLTPDEEQKLGAQLGQILGYIEKLNQLEAGDKLSEEQKANIRAIFGMTDEN